MGSKSTTEKGSATTKNVTDNAPPDWAKPMFERGGKDAMDLYNRGIGGHVYEGQRVADLSDGTKGAIDQLNKAAGNYNNDYLNDLLTKKNASASNLAGMAAGDMVGKNPYFNDALQNQLDKVRDMTNSQFSGAGRYGSGANTSVLANQLGGVATNAMAQQYNQDVQNMMHANGMIDQANQGQVNTANSFYQGAENAARGALAGNSVIDANNQAKIDADRQKFNEQDNEAWNRLKMLLSAGQMAAGNYGTQTQNGTQSYNKEKREPFDWGKFIGGIGSGLTGFGG